MVFSIHESDLDNGSDGKMDSDSQNPETQYEPQDTTTVRVLALLQIVFVMLSLMFGGIIFVGNFVYAIEGWLGIVIAVPEFLGAWMLQSLIILMLTFFLLRSNQGVSDRIPDAFASSFYLYLLLAVIYATIGWIGLIFIGVIGLQLLFLFLPGVRYFWFEEFKEDTKPRIKETRFTLHLIRKSPLVVAGIAIIVFMVGVAFAAPWIAPYKGTDMVFDDVRLPPGSPSNDIKQNYEYLLEDRYFNPEIMPDYKYGAVRITEAYLQTIEIPKLFVGVSDLRTGADAVSVNVTFRIYSLNLTDYQDMTAAERRTYLYANVSVLNQNLLQYIQLPDEVGNYVWELQFIAPYKTSTWSANTRIVIA